MAKLVYLVILLGVVSFLNQQQSVEAKPLLSANFFVLTTRAPTSDSASALTGRVVNWNLTGYFTRKLSFFMGLLSRGGGGVTGKFNLNGIRSTTTTTTEAPESSELPETSYVPDTTQSIKSTTTAATTRATTKATTRATTKATTEWTYSTTESSEEIVSTTSGGLYPDSTVRPQPPISTRRTTSSGYEYTTGRTSSTSNVYPTSRPGTTPGPTYLPASRGDLSNDI